MSPTALREQGVGLALGGGAARGLAHIGVLKVLEQEGIRVDRVAGSSAGSVVGAAFCAGLSWREILSRAREVDWFDIASFAVPRMGLMSTQRLELLLDELLERRTFEALRVPLSVVAVDIVAGEQVVLCRGSVAQAVRASCSIPGIFEPVVVGGRSLVDGGLLNNMPTDVVRRMGGGTVVGVDLNADRSQAGPPRNILDVMSYSFSMLLRNSQQGRAPDDIVVAPRLSGFGYHDFRRVDEMVAAGERAMRSEMCSLKERLHA